MECSGLRSGFPWQWITWLVRYLAKSSGMISTRDVYARYARVPVAKNYKINNKSPCQATNAAFGVQYYIDRYGPQASESHLYGGEMCI